MKQKCRENRKARKKRDNKFLARLVHKRLDALILKAERKAPTYYEVRYVKVRTMVKAGRRLFDLRRLTYVTVPTEAHRRLYAEIVAKIPADLTVTVPRAGEGGRP